MGIDLYELKQRFEDEANNYRFIFFRLKNRTIDDNVETVIAIEKSVATMLKNQPATACEVLAVFDTVSLLFDEYHDLRGLYGESVQRSGPWDDEVSIPVIDPFKEDDDPYRETAAILVVFLDADEESEICVASTALISINEIGGEIFQKAKATNLGSEIAVSIVEKMKRLQETVVGNRSERLKTALAAPSVDSVEDRDRRLYTISLDSMITWENVGKIVGKEFDEDISRKAAENAARRYHAAHPELEPIPPRRKGRRPKRQ